MLKMNKVLGLDSIYLFIYLFTYLFIYYFTIIIIIFVLVKLKLVFHNFPASSRTNETTLLNVELTASLP